MIITGMTLEKMESRVDKTMKLIFSTQELPPDQMAILFAFLHNFINVAISETEVPEEELEELTDRKLGGFSQTKRKSQSQRIRSTLYRLWELEKPDLDFDAYYQLKTENIISLIKAQLEKYH